MMVALGHDPKWPLVTGLLTLVANSRGRLIGPSLGKVSKTAKGISAALTVSSEFATSVTVGSTP
jgi:hypothetical protein